MRDRNCLIMPFLDASPSFCHGYECGRIWVEMENNTIFKMYLMHTENMEQIKLMAGHFGYDISFKVYDDTWAYLSGRPVDISEIKL